MPVAYYERVWASRYLANTSIGMGIMVVDRRLGQPEYRTLLAVYY